MIRRFGEPVKDGTKYQHRPGAYAILWDGKSLLLTRQTLEEGRLELQLPGGGIDPGEHPIPALHREVFEETGWTMGPARKLGVFRRFVFMIEYGFWAEKLCHIYLASPTIKRGPPLEEGHIAVWATPEDAAKHLENEGDRFFVRQAFNL